jgi:FkbM family methyltransferase
MKQKIKEIFRKNKFIYGLLLPLYKIKRRINYRHQIFFDKLFLSIVEGNLIVNVNNIPGQFEMDARSHILKNILLSKDYEPEIVNLIQKNIDPSKDAINIGANIGLYTIFLANRINANSKVLAIEPTPNAFKFLKSNINRNDYDNKVILYNGIATDQPGIYKINIIPGNEEYSSIGEIAHLSIKDKEPISIEVIGETIDNLIEKYNLKPGLMVIDVEGAESNVLLGAIKTLKKYHPIIITELDDNLLSKQNSNSTQVIRFLENLKYKIVDSDNKIPKFPFMGNIIAKNNT